MRRMLEELYYGNINPNDQRYTENSEFDRAMHTLSENEGKLTELLEGREKKLLIDFVKAQGIINSTTALESYISGFRLGARLAIEVMDENDGCLVDID